MSITIFLDIAFYVMLDSDYWLHTWCEYMTSRNAVSRKATATNRMHKNLVKFGFQTMRVYRQTDILITVRFTPPKREVIIFLYFIQRFAVVFSIFPTFDYQSTLNCFSIAWLSFTKALI